MTPETKAFIEFATSVKQQYLIHWQIALDAQAAAEVRDSYTDVTDFLDELIGVIAKNNPKTNYLNQFLNDISTAVNYLPYRGETNNGFVKGNERVVAGNLKANLQNIKNLLSAMKFKLNFFKKLGFFNDNIVAIGANGSGKTSLSDRLKVYLSNNGVVIAAQRVLLVPIIDSVSNPSKTHSELKNIQTTDKKNKNPNNFHLLRDEFGIVLKNLISENNALGNDYRTKALELSKNGISIPQPPISNLDTTLRIWNSLITHRKISCHDGINIMVEWAKTEPYPIVEASDGEKVMLYLIAQVLQAPADGFIIIDEPEMYLHKTILKKLWDVLEKERNDCIFIYLTHDLDFATSRTIAKKVWIKSFIHPDSWEIESLPENELPESLLMELLGSRKNILFCEGEKGKIDEKIYNILFPDYTISPVGGCFEVINHTKAFNKIPNITTKAFGLIDSDHHPVDRLSRLKSHNIYHFKVAEVENLLLDEEFLRKLGSSILADIALIPNIKSDTVAELNKYKESQASNFITARIDYYFKDSNLKKGNTLVDLESNFAKFISEINIKELYNERIKELDDIISSSDYVKTISVFNNKGVNSCVQKHFKITDFTDRAIKLLQSDESTHAILLKYFPNELAK